MDRKDSFSPEKRSEVMSAVGSEDTEPELKLRNSLWHEGLRYRVHEKVEGTKPDLVFPGPQVAVFVDGCFWHGCPEHYSAPETNAKFWREKLERNQARDERDNERLEKAGWTVLRVWECEVRKQLDRIVPGIVREVRAAYGDGG